MSDGCPVCGKPWSSRISQTRLPKEKDLTEYGLPKGAVGHRLCLTEEQLYVHLVYE